MFTVAFEADTKNLHCNKDCSEAPQEDHLHLYIFGSMNWKAKITELAPPPVTFPSPRFCLAQYLNRYACSRAKEWQFCFLS